MADPLPKEMLDAAVDPTRVARQKFEFERRGFDQQQVRAYLIAVGDALRDAQSREADIRSRLGKAIRRAERAEAAARETKTSDPSELTRQLGDEVAGVLDAARVAGEQRIAAAEGSAETLLANAKTEATRVRQAAETIMDERRAEADAAAGEILDAARAQAGQIVGTATSDADALRSDAAEDVQRVQRECDALIAEAEAARLQVLQDMDRRRRQARAQVERLRVGRDRLLRSYEVVRRTLEESTSELKVALPEAKVLGDSAARRVVGESLANPHQLEAEIADARLIRGDGDKAAPTRSTRNRSETPAKPAARPELPTVDMRPATFSAESAPTPRRPVIAERPAVPRPPVTAPTIKAPADDSDGEDSNDTKEETLVARPPDAAPTDQAADDDAAMPTPPASQPQQRPTDESAAAAESVALSIVRDDEDDASTEAATSDAEATDEDFADLPKGVLAIVDASDDIEEVVALPLDGGVDVVDDSGEAEHTDDELVVWVDDSGEAESVDAAPVGEAPESIDSEESSDTDGAESAEAAPSADNTSDEVAPAADADADADGAEDAEPAVATSGLFAALRAQRGGDEASSAEIDAAAAEAAAEAAAIAADMAAQRSAIVTASAIDIHKRLKRALADEQNDVLAGIRAAAKAKKNADPLVLVDLVGDRDLHVQRYVSAINEVAAGVYGAGAALLDEEAPLAEMPAGAVEECLLAEVVLPLRERLEALDAEAVDTPTVHVDAIRAFYRQRKTSHLESAAESLASLLVTAGACDVLPSDRSLPWLAASHS